MTPMEGRGLLRGALLLLAFSLVRIFLLEIRDSGPVSVVGEDQLPALLDEARSIRVEQLKRAEPLKPGETVDPNRASEEELDRLPGVGAQVAGAIARYRVEEKGFRQAEDLLEVPGIGPATLARIRPHLDFSAGLPVGLRGGSQVQGRLDLNRAGLEDLQGLPGIGPALAARILESRSREGPFEKAEDLLRVQGIGPVKLARILPLVQVGR